MGSSQLPRPARFTLNHGTSHIPTVLEPRSGIRRVRAVLRRILAVAAARAEPVPSRATKAHNIARKNLVAAVLYDAAEPGLKRSRETAGPPERRRSVPRMRGRRYENI